MNGMLYAGYQSLFLLNCLRSKNMLFKTSKVLKVTSKPMVMKKVMKFEELERVRTLSCIMNLYREEKS